MPFSLAQSSFIPELSEKDAMTVCMICGSQLKIKAFDFRPDLEIDVTKDID